MSKCSRVGKTLRPPLAQMREDALASQSGRQTTFEGERFRDSLVKAQGQGPESGSAGPWKVCSDTGSDGDANANTNTATESDTTGHSNIKH